MLLWILLSTVTTIGCSTVQVETKIELPPMPQREEIKEPKSVKDLAGLVIYYEFLVSRWEAWGNTVEEITEGVSHG